jgi:hypothetical protein
MNALVAKVRNTLAPERTASDMRGEAKAWRVRE